MAIGGNDKLCAEIAEILGIKNCRRMVIHMKIDETVIVTAEFYPERDQMKDISAVLKRYKLELVEIE